MTLEVALDRAMELNQRVTEIAKSLRLEWIAPDPTWFGIDPIHIRRRHWSAAWVRMLHPLRDVEQNGFSNQQRANLRKRRLQDKHRWFFGIEQRRPQPGEQHRQRHLHEPAAGTRAFAFIGGNVPHRIGVAGAIAA